MSLLREEEDLTATEAATALLQDMFDSLMVVASLGNENTERIRLERAQLHDTALEIMLQSPTLASNLFSYPGGSTMHPPLYIFVKTGANYDNISKVYDLYEEAIQHENGACFHEACHSRLHDDLTIIFLLEKYPAALTNTSPLADDEPFIFSLLSGSPRWDRADAVETLTAMMELNPDCHRCRPTWANRRPGASMGVYPLSTALVHASHTELLEYMLSQFPADLDGEFQLDHCTSSPASGRHHAMDEVRAGILVQLLPRIRNLNLQGTTFWTHAGMACFLNSLPEQETLRSLHLALPRGLLQNLSSVLERSLAGNTSLRLLAVRMVDVAENHDSLMGVDDRILKALSAGTRRMANLAKLWLESFNLTDPRTLVEFIASGGAPKSLRLAGFGFTSDQDELAPEEWQACRVEAIELDMIEGTKQIDSLCCMLLPSIPTLRAVRLYAASADEDADITVGLVDMLSKRSLHSFVSVGLTGNTKSICEALKMNQTLKFYSFEATTKEDWQKTCFAELLSEHNTTLCHVACGGSGDNEETEEETPEEDSSPSACIRHWTRLNELGRRCLRDPSLSSQSFAGILCDAKEKEAASPLDELNACFGLLREAPGIWISDFGKCFEKEETRRMEESERSEASNSSASEVPRSHKSRRSRRLTRVLRAGFRRVISRPNVVSRGAA